MHPDGLAFPDVFENLAAVVNKRGQADKIEIHVIANNWLHRSRKGNATHFEGMFCQTTDICVVLSTGRWSGDKALTRAHCVEIQLCGKLVPRMSKAVYDSIELCFQISLADRRVIVHDANDRMGWLKPVNGLNLNLVGLDGVFRVGLKLA